MHRVLSLLALGGAVAILLGTPRVRPLGRTLGVPNRIPIALPQHPPQSDDT